jgi:hypothetical protein
MKRVQTTHTTVDTYLQTQYTTRLRLRGSQIRLLPGNQITERENCEDEEILYTRRNLKKIKSAAPLSSLELNALFWGQSVTE